MLTATIIFQCILLAYHQFTTWIDLFPFNGVRFYTRKERLIECASNGILMGLPIIGFLFNLRSLMNFGVVYYFILFILEIKTWWLPYWFSVSEKWKEEYAKIHAKTLIILPKIRKNPIPNLEHMILHGITLLTAIFTLVVFLKK